MLIVRSCGLKYVDIDIEHCTIRQGGVISEQGPHEARLSCMVWECMGLYEKNVI